MRRSLIIITSSVLLQLPHAKALEQNDYRLKLGDEQQYRLPARAMASSTHPALSEKPYAREIAEAANQAGLDPALVHALIEVESAYRADAISEKGARGLMQLMPDTARRFGVTDASQPRPNLLAGTRYLRYLLNRYEQRTDLALAAYNAGEGAVAKYADSIPPYPETQRYVPAVIGKLNARRSLPTKKGIDYAAGTRLTVTASTTIGTSNLLQDGRKKVAPAPAQL